MKAMRVSSNSSDKGGIAMKLPLKWLKDYVDYNVSHEEFVKRMLWRGFEIAQVIPEMPNIHNIVVCTILGIEQHPDAERLRVCSVDIGAREPITVVTNSSDVYEGCQVPVALDNAVLSDGTVIKPVKMRGIKSFGMFCGAEELGITEAEYDGAGGDGVLILNEQHPCGQRIQEALDLDDVIFDIELTPNRADCQSIIGICREAACALGQKFKEPVIEMIEGEGRTEDYASVTVLNPKLCPRYCARVVTDLNIEPSPKWMQRRLRSVGLRPINNIVDITNYVLTEYGHPMHAFDLACIDDAHIVVRNARDGETVTTLDGKERRMSEDMLLIADPHKGVGIAGVMGGENSEITPDTKATLFESAVFMPSNIRLTTQKLHHTTDSSARFAKGVEPANAKLALDRAIELVHMLNAGRIVGSMIDVCSVNLEQKQVTADPGHINRILNTSLSADNMCELLDGIGINASVRAGLLKVQVPHFRMDIEDGIETDWDIAEEVGRLYGYDRIAPTLMNGETFRGAVGVDFRNEDKAKDTMAALGFYELYSMNFISPTELDSLMLCANDEKRLAVKLINPFGEDQSLMRTTLIGGLLRVMALNCNRKTGNRRFFEIGNVHFNNNNDLPEERKMLGAVCFGEKESFYTLKGCLEQLFERMGIKDVRFIAGGGEYLHPTQKARIEIDGLTVGELGTINPKVQRAFSLPMCAYVAELDFKKLCSKIAGIRKYTSLPKYPLVPRDIAVIVANDVDAQTVIDVICSAKTPIIIENVRAFDVYYPKCPGDKGIPDGKKSMAFSFSLRSNERTLNDEDITQAMNAILKTLKYRLDAVLRS